MSPNQGKEWTFKTIVEADDNWAKYQKAYANEVTPHQIQEVEKMLGCGDSKKGFATYMCLDCGSEKRISFSCKSRICSSCGKVHADEWSEQLSGRLWKITHRHMTFTLPSELWPLLEANESWRKELFGAAYATLEKVMDNQPGVVVTLHQYGKDLKVNYHVHVLVTEGGMTEAGFWRPQRYIDYKNLRRIWQYEMLSRMKAVMPDTVENKRLVNDLYMRNSNGFYVHAEPRVKDGHGVGRYIGRYLRHPAIADSRIIGYDGETVTFVYQAKVKGKKVWQKEILEVLEFIHSVIRHIPPKQFKMVRYYGLYAPRKKAAVKQLMQKLGNMLGGAVRHLSWRARQIRDFHSDPLTCTDCGSREMVLFSLTVPSAGGMMTIGGWSWLFARGDLIDTPLPHSDTSVQPTYLPLQNSLGLTVAA